jgi:hypothetical protein
MSRRFGRNQRRRARERIAELERASASCMVVVQQEQRRADAYRAIVDGIKDALGPDSVLFEPVMREAMNYFLPTVAIQEQVDLGGVEEWNQSLNAMSTIRQHTADVFSAGIERDHFARRIHFLLEFKDRAIAAYAIDSRLLDDAKRNGRLAHLIERNITRVMARMFMAELMKGNAS